MKLRTFAAAAALCIGAALPGLALAGDQDFTLVNRTGYTISEVYVAPSKSSDWEEDVLGQDTLEDKTTVDIQFSRGEDTCRWDLKVVYDDETTAEWAALDLCTVSKVTIFYNAKTDTTSAQTE